MNTWIIVGVSFLDVAPSKRQVEFVYNVIYKYYKNENSLHLKFKKLSLKKFHSSILKWHQIQHSKEESVFGDQTIWFISIIGGHQKSNFGLQEEYST